MQSNPHLYINLDISRISQDKKLFMNICSVTLGGFTPHDAHSKLLSLSANSRFFNKYTRDKKITEYLKHCNIRHFITKCLCERSLYLHSMQLNRRNHICQRHIMPSAQII